MKKTAAKTATPAAELARIPLAQIIPCAWNPRQIDLASADLAELAQERIITYSKNSRPHQDIVALMQASGVMAPRLNCVNSVSAITRLLRDGFGIGALPPVLVTEELARGELILLDIEQRPANLPVVVSWRVGVEWVEEIVTLCQQVLAGYAQKVGEDCITLTE